MPQILKLTQLINKHRVAEMQIRRCRVESRLDAQRLTAFELFNQLGLDQNLFRTALDQRQLFFNRLHDRTHNHSK